MTEHDGSDPNRDNRLPPSESDPAVGNWDITQLEPDFQAERDRAFQLLREQITAVEDLAQRCNQIESYHSFENAYGIVHVWVGPTTIPQDHGTTAPGTRIIVNELWPGSYDDEPERLVLFVSDFVLHEELDRIDRIGTDQPWSPEDVEPTTDPRLSVSGNRLFAQWGEAYDPPQPTKWAQETCLEITDATILAKNAHEILSQLSASTIRPLFTLFDNPDQTNN